MRNGVTQMLVCGSGLPKAGPRVTRWQGSNGAGDLLGATGKGVVEGDGKEVGKMEWGMNRLIRDEAWSLAQTCDLQTINSTVRCQSSTSRNAACHAVVRRRSPRRRR